MATDFNKNCIVTAGGMRPSVSDTPVDIRTRIETIDDIYEVPVPYVGMIIYCKEDDCYYKVLSLKPKRIGAINIPDSLVDKYERYDIKDLVINGGTIEISNEELIELLQANDLIGTEAATVADIGIDMYCTKAYTDKKVNELENIISNMQKIIDLLLYKVNDLEKKVYELENK